MVLEIKTLQNDYDPMPSNQGAQANKVQEELATENSKKENEIDRSTYPTPRRHCRSCPRDRVRSGIWFCNNDRVGFIEPPD